MSNQIIKFNTILGRLLFVLCLFFSTGAISATFNVDSMVDGVDAAPGDGACISVVGGLCTLRAAIQESNALAGNDTIVLAAGTYQLTITGAGEDAAATGDLDITGGGDLAIIGAGIDDSIIFAGHPSGNRFGLKDRVFHILATAGKVTFSQFTAGNAWTTGENGAGVFNAGPNTILNNVEISDNNARALFDSSAPKELGTGITQSTYGLGGGIFNAVEASLLLDRSRVVYNASGNFSFYDTASRTFSGGGAIHNSGFLEIRNQSRIEYNSAKQGGGITNTGTTKITDSIIMFNEASAIGGGISNRGGILTVRRSYIGQNRGGSGGAGIANHPGAAGSIAVVIESAIDNNTAMLAMGGGVSNFAYMYIGYSSVSWNSVEGLGAAISSSGNAELIVENTTIVGNSTNSLGAYGSGIHTSAEVMLNQVTITGNFANGIFAEDLYINTRDFNLNDPKDWVTIKNSIIGDEAYRRKLFFTTGRMTEEQANLDNYCGGGYSENDGIGGSIISIGDNISTDEYLGLIKSEGYNISSGSTCALSATGDQVSTAPDLLDAGAYGGATLPSGPFLPNPITRPPAATSLARNVIPVNDCALQIDQRIFARPSDGACDVGAAEYGDVVSTYADLDLSATSEPGVVIARGQPVRYRLVIRNLGPSVSTGLEGSALVTNFEFDGMTLTDSSFIAPDGEGQVSCATSANASGVKQWADCSFDRPLMPNTELIIFLSLATDTQMSQLSVSANINNSATPDPFDYNNQITLTHRVSSHIQLQISDTPEEAIPVTTSGGTMSLYELFMLVMLAIIFALFRLNARHKFPLKFGVGSMLFFYLTSGHAALPTITNITPNTGSASAETTITITGTDFDENVTIGLLNDLAVTSIVAKIEAGDAIHIEKQNNLLYLSSGIPGSATAGIISVHDVTNPSAPVLVNNMRLPTRGIGGLPGQKVVVSGLVARSDNNLFIPANGLFIYDFNTPSAPILKKHFPLFTQTNGQHTGIGGTKSRILIDGERLYSIQRGGIGGKGGKILIVDSSITTGANAFAFIRLNVLAGSVYRTDLITIPTNTGPRKFFLIAGRSTMVNVEGVPTEGELVIFDVTDPSNPVTVYAVVGPTRPEAAGRNDRIVDAAFKILTTGSDTKLYVIVATTNTYLASPAGIHVYDVGPDTGFSNLSPIYSYLKLGNFDEVYVNGDVLTAHDLNVGAVRPSYYDFDISDPSVPKLIGGPYSVGSASSFYRPQYSMVNEGYIYTSGGFIYKRNPTITITNVTATTITATVPAGFIPQLYDLVVSNPAGETEEVILLDAFTVP